MSIEALFIGVLVAGLLDMAGVNYPPLYWFVGVLTGDIAMRLAR